MNGAIGIMVNTAKSSLAFQPIDRNNNKVKITTRISGFLGMGQLVHPLSSDGFKKIYNSIFRLAHEKIEE